MPKKYQGFKGSGMREIDSPKYEKARLEQLISNTLLRKIIPNWTMYEIDEEDRYLNG